MVVTTIQLFAASAVPVSFSDTLSMMLQRYPLRPLSVPCALLAHVFLLKWVLIC